MSKHNSSGRATTTGQIALTHRQRRRARGEVYRQPPRVRTRTQLAVQTLNGAQSAAPDHSSSVLTAATDAATVGVPTTAPLDPPAATDALPLENVPSGEAVPDASAPDASQSAPRLPRRTRTLADVVQPRRDPALSSGTHTSPSLPSIPSLPSTGPLSDPTLPLPIIAAASAPASADMPVEPDTGDAAERDETPPLAGTDVIALDNPARDSGDEMTAQSDATDAAGQPTLPSLTSIPVPTRARLSRETAPITAVAGPAADPPMRGRAGDPWGATPAAMKDDDEVPARFARASRRGSPALARQVAQGHAIAGVVLAVVASALVLLAQPVGVWLLALAVVALAGGGLAALLLWWRRAGRAAVVVLALAQMGALAWACALVGPRAALLVLAAPAVALALRVGGRAPALFAGTGFVAIYAAFQIAASQALPPSFVPPALALAAGDTLAVALGVGLLLAELLVAAASRTRSEAAARARLYEIRLLRERIGALRGEIEEGGDRLDAALAQALRGRGLNPLAVDGPLNRIATSITAAAERLRTLQQDREDRLRLESAVRALARALERGWLGMPWTWPDPSGTLLDEVVMLLRTPRPADSLAEERIERRASPHSGPLGPLSAFPRDASTALNPSGSGVFGSGADWREPDV